MGTFIEEATFWGLAVPTVGGALIMVQTQSVFRAALGLVVSLLGVAAIFVLLNAEFLAVVQVLVYVGAISILIIFAVMFTTGVVHGNRASTIWPVTLAAALLMLFLLAGGILASSWSELPDPLPEGVASTFLNSPQHLGELLVGDFVLAFEVAGVVLLAAVIGALALVRTHSSDDGGGQ